MAQLSICYYVHVHVCVSLLDLSSVLFIVIGYRLFQPWLRSYCSEDRGRFYRNGLAEHSTLNKGGF